jgi:hypothetical protein
MYLKAAAVAAAQQQYLDQFDGHGMSTEAIKSPEIYIMI